MAQGYDDYYSDVSSYSKYPTDDKKYECILTNINSYYYLIIFTITNLAS